MGSWRMARLELKVGVIEFCRETKVKNRGEGRSRMEQRGGFCHLCREEGENEGK